MNKQTLIDDILIHLPNWTNTPHPSKCNRHHHHHHHGEREDCCGRKECAKEVPAFINEFASAGELHEEFDYRNHVSNEEILRTYHITRIRITTWLDRSEIPSTPDCYLATCLWTAGVLENKYKFKDSRKSTLIKDAQKILTPYIRIYYRILNGNHHHHHHHHGLYHGPNNRIIINCMEEYECREDMNIQ